MKARIDERVLENFKKFISEGITNNNELQRHNKVFIKRIFSSDSIQVRKMSGNCRRIMKRSSTMDSTIKSGCTLSWMISWEMKILSIFDLQVNKFVFTVNNLPSSPEYFT